MNDEARLLGAVHVWGRTLHRLDYLQNRGHSLARDRVNRLAWRENERRIEIVEEDARIAAGEVEHLLYEWKYE